MTEWRTVVGHPMYKVSDDGQVYSTYSNRLLKPSTLSSGHIRVVVDRRHRTVHTLMAEAFLGPRPDEQEVRHLNGNPSDNRLENLTYGSKSENAYDSIEHGTHFNASKTHCKRGHPFDASNTIITTHGRQCRTCRSLTNLRYNSRKRAERGPDWRPANVRADAETHCANGHLYTDGSFSIIKSGARRCLICHRGAEKARQDRLNPGRGVAAKDRTHCPKGHEYNEENTGFKNGHRRCKACHREQETARYRAKRER